MDSVWVYHKKNIFTTKGKIKMDLINIFAYVVIFFSFIYFLKKGIDNAKLKNKVEAFLYFIASAFMITGFFFSLAISNGYKHPSSEAMFLFIKISSYSFAFFGVLYIIAFIISIIKLLLNRR